MLFRSKDFSIISPTVFISIPKRWVQIYDSINDSIDLDLSSEEEINEKLKNITGGNLKWGLSAAGYLDPDIFLFFQENKIVVSSKKIKKRWQSLIFIIALFNRGHHFAS